MRGTVVELDVEGQRVVLRVTTASRPARRLIGETVPVSLHGARLRLPDADGDRSTSLRDVFPGNEVEVRLSRRGESGELVARALSHVAPEMPVGGLRRLWH